MSNSEGCHPMQRKESPVIQHKSRFRPALHARIKKAADARGVTFNEEITARLERSVTRDDAMGGPAVSRVAMLMAAAFGLAVSRKAPDDPDAYVAGVSGVLRALIVQAPRPFTKVETEALVSQILTLQFAGGKADAR